MSSSRALVEAALERMLGQYLEQQGYLRRGWRFLRSRDEFIDLVCIEWKDAACRAILGVEPRLFPSARREQIPDFAHLPAHEWQFQRYVGPEGGFWFQFEGGFSDEALVLAQAIEDRIDEGSEGFLAHFQSLEQFTSHSPDDIPRDRQLLALFEGNQRLAALFFCNLHMWLGNVDRAKAFAQFGLSVKKGTIGQQRMRSILAR